MLVRTEKDKEKHVNMQKRSMEKFSLKLEKVVTTVTALI